MTLLWLSLALAGPLEDRALIGQLDREVIALKQRVEHLQSQLATCTVDTSLAPIYTELRTVLAGRPAVVSREGLSVRVTVPHSELFGAGAASLREEADPLLDLLATAIKVHPEVRVTVAAYNDSPNVPSALRKVVPSVWELTALRASLVVRTLIERFAVPPEVLTAAGRGVQEPVVTDTDSELAVENRRVVFILEPGKSP